MKQRWRTTPALEITDYWTVLLEIAVNIKVRKKNVEMNVECKKIQPSFLKLLAS